MYQISDNPPLPEAQDICLLLRSHGEQRWLISEVLPVLRHVETPGSIPEDQLGAALAYLELLWLDATRRARETDAAYAKLDSEDPLHDHDHVLYEKARRYHAAVHRLRTAVARRVAERTRRSAEHPVVGTPGAEPIAYAQPHAAALRSAVALHALRRRPLGR